MVLPWGSLMRGVLSADDAMVSRLTGLLRAGGRLELLLSIVEADAGADMPALDENRARALASEYGRLGLTVEEVRLAEDADIDRLGRAGDAGSAYQRTARRGYCASSHERSVLRLDRSRRDLAARRQQWLPDRRAGACPLVARHRPECGHDRCAGADRPVLTQRLAVADPLIVIGYLLLYVAFVVGTLGLAGPRYSTRLQRIAYGGLLLLVAIPPTVLLALAPALVVAGAALVRPDEREAGASYGVQIGSPPWGTQSIARDSHADSRDHPQCRR